VAIISFSFLTNPFQAFMSEAIQKQVLELVNIERSAQNLASLKSNSVLNQSALAKANDMIAKGYFAHFSPSGEKPWDFINRDKYPYLYVGENLAMNFTSANSAHKALMNSPSHKKNIMNEQYTEVGMAVISGEISGKQTNILVQMFATRSSIEPATAVAETSAQEKQNLEPVPVLENNKTEAAPQPQSEPKPEIPKKEKVVPTPVPEEPKVDYCGRNRESTIYFQQIWSLLHPSYWPAKISNIHSRLPAPVREKDQKT
jgi:hypothetical protein